MLEQILRGCFPLSLALLVVRLVWLGLARQYKFTTLYAIVQVLVSIWLLYQFPSIETVGYTWAWTLTRWPIMALLVGTTIEISRPVYACGSPTRLPRLALLLLPGTIATLAVVVLWQFSTIEWSSPYLVVMAFQITCLIYSSLFLAAKLPRAWLASYWSQPPRRPVSLQLRKSPVHLSHL